MSDILVFLGMFSQWTLKSDLLISCTGLRADAVWVLAEQFSIYWYCMGSLCLHKCATGHSATVWLQHLYSCTVCTLAWACIQSYIAKFTYEQYATVNQQLQDVSTWGSLSTAYKWQLQSYIAAPSCGVTPVWLCSSMCDCINLTQQLQLLSTLSIAIPCILWCHGCLHSSVHLAWYNS